MCHWLLDESNNKKPPNGAEQERKQKHCIRFWSFAWYFLADWKLQIMLSLTATAVVFCGALSVAVEITLFSRFSFTAIIIGFRLESFSLSFSIDFSSCFYNCSLLMIFCASFSFCWMFLCSRALWASIYINIDQALRQCDFMHKRKLIFLHTSVGCSTFLSALLALVRARWMCSP